MGLGLTVGILADLDRNDAEGAEWVRDELSATNDALRHNNLPTHEEPTDCEVWSVDGYGYSGLHALREVAGRVWAGKPVPRDALLDGSDTPYNEALFEAALPELTNGAAKGLFARLFGKSRAKHLPFLHLVCHSDAQGYYVPVDFAFPVMPVEMDDDTAHLWPLGSAPALAREITELSGILEIPADLTAASQTMQDAMEKPDADPDLPLWRAQPIATYSALILREACAASARTGAAISFG
ncbi:MAG: hypothetical protein HKO04_05315 [Silicimonas sp.]|nr:hypothetical protein [Silicimonas sp.]